MGEKPEQGASELLRVYKQERDQLSERKTCLFFLREARASMPIPCPLYRDGTHASKEPRERRSLACLSGRACSQSSFARENAYSIVEERLFSRREDKK